MFANRISQYFENDFQMNEEVSMPHSVAFMACPVVCFVGAVGSQREFVQAVYELAATQTCEILQKQARRNARHAFSVN